MCATPKPKHLLQNWSETLNFYREMYKNQLQELAQRSCFNLPSYTCIREGPDHAPRFKAIVNFNGETFESPQFCSNLRLAEHAAAEAALASLSSRGTSHSLAARILDETGVYKNLLQEIAQRVGSPLPRYTTYRSGFGHVHVFTGVVELAGITFRGEPAKNKKQAEKNAAQAAWSSLKQLAQNDASSSADNETNEEQEQIRIARALQNYRMKQNTTTANSISVSPRPSSPHRPAISTSKILPLFGQRTASQSRHDAHTTYSLPSPSPRPQSPEVRRTTQKPRYLPTKDSVTNANNSVSFGTPPYRPVNQCRLPYRGIVPPVTIRTSTPVFSAPPLPPPARVMQGRTSGAVPPVRIRQAIPVFSPPPLLDNTPMALAAPALSEEAAADNMCDVDESTAIKCLELLEM